MEVTINQVILHLLDPGASEPMLSDRAMEMDADLFEYFTAVLSQRSSSRRNRIKRKYHALSLIFTASCRPSCCGIRF